MGACLKGGSFEIKIGGSCPYVYSWDGQRFVYSSDVGGVALVSGAYDLSGGKPMYWAPMSVPLPNSLVEDGVVKALMVEGQDEITYLDSALLHVLKHKRGHVVYSTTANYYNLLKEDDPQKYLSFPASSLVYPVSASWQDEVDVTEAIRECNDTPVAFDLAQDNWYTFDFGEVSQSENLHLLIDGWKTKIMRPGYPADKTNSRPRLQVKDAEGNWVFDKKLTFPRGDRKTVVFDLSDVVFPSGRYEMRVYTGTSRDAMATWFIDSAKITTVAPSEPVFTTVYPSSAELQKYGLPEYHYKGDETRPLTNSPNGKGTPNIPTYTSGNFTKYGDVSPLIKESDGKLCIMQKGDGILFSFNVAELNSEEYEQAYFLHTDLVYKAQICPGVSRTIGYLRTVEPLPSRDAAVYPPREEVVESEEIKNYREEWNTRVYEPFQRVESLAPM